MTVDLFAQGPPVELHERVLLGPLAHDAFRDSRAVAESRQVQLPHFSAAAHVVHQVECVSFAANESHGTHPAMLDLSVGYCASCIASRLFLYSVGCLTIRRCNSGLTR